MRKAKTYFYSKNIEMFKESDKEGVKTVIQTNSKHIEKALEISHLEGLLDGRDGFHPDVVEDIENELKELLI